MPYLPDDLGPVGDRRRHTDERLIELFEDEIVVRREVDRRGTELQP